MASSSGSRSGTSSRVVPVPGRLWVSVSRKTGFRRLHLHGACWYKAEVAEEVEDHTKVEHNAPCRVCWKGAGDAEKMLQKAVDDDSSVTTDDESSSSELS